MRTVFEGKRITGILGVLPETEYCFDDEVYNFDAPVKQSMRLKKVMGYDKHRVAKDTSTTSDFCIYGLRYLLEKGLVKKEEIGALVVVSISQDYNIPHVSNILHGTFGFDQEVLCVDVAQGCVGFLLGLMESFFILEHMKDKKVLLFNADVLTKGGSKKDRNSYPLSGDAAGITVIENDAAAEKIYFSIHTDGSRRSALVIRGKDWITTHIGNGEQEAKEDIGADEEKGSHAGMNGSEVFNFVQVEVPPLIDEILEYAKETKENIDYYLFHQPNKFMLQKLAAKAEIPEEKLFMNIVEKYGNSSGATIPITVAENLRETIVNEEYRCCLAAFGSGLTWGAMVMNLGKLDFCDLIISDC